MILFQNSRIMQSIERPVAAGQTITAEGAPLVVDNTGGVFGVRHSTGGGSEQFAGISLAQQLTIQYQAKYEVLTADESANPKLNLAKIPTASGSIRLYNVTGAVVHTFNATTAATPAGPNTYNLPANGTVVWLPAANAGDVFNISYRYAVTVVEAQQLAGNIPPGGAAALTLGSVGVITIGDVITSEFDTAVDWSVANPVIKLSSAGLFTIGGSGITVPNAYVMSVPTPDSPFLGIHIAV